MIILDAIAEKIAENARRSLAAQVAIRRAAGLERPVGKNPNDKPFTILDDTEELSVTCEEFIKNLQAQPLADLLGISEEEVRRRLKRGKSVHFLPIAGGTIKYIHSAPGRIVGTLAFSVLRDCPVMQDGDVEHTELKPGQVMYYDGDEPIKWQSTEEGFGLMM